MNRLVRQQCIVKLFSSMSCPYKMTGPFRNPTNGCLFLFSCFTCFQRSGSRLRRIFFSEHLLFFCFPIMPLRSERSPSPFNLDSGPVSIQPSFPTALFQVGGFHIQCFEQPWMQPTLTLVERPSIDHGLLRKHLTLHPHHRQLIESYLSPCLPQNSSIEIGYSPRATDTKDVSIAAPWAVKEYRGQQDSCCSDATIVKLTLRGLSTSLFDAWDHSSCLTMYPSQPSMIFVPSFTATPTSKRWKHFALILSNSSH